MTKTLEVSHGRWREILPQLGISPKALNGKNQPCPNCGGEDRFNYTDRQGDGDYYCRGCGPGKGISLVAKVNGWTYAEAARRVDEIVGNLSSTTASAPVVEKPDHRIALRQLSAASQTITTGDPVWRYLTARGFSEPFPEALRYVPEMYHSGTRSNHPGMIAAVSDVDGKVRMLHRTYLTEDGSKAQLSTSKMFMPGPFPLGGAVRLGVLAEKIGIAEGIETALAASAIYRMPVWAALNEICLRNWEPPAGVTHVVVFGDNDDNFVGQAAAYSLAKHLVLEKSLIAAVRIPKNKESDWNDELLLRQAEERGVERDRAA